MKLPSAKNLRKSFNIYYKFINKLKDLESWDRVFLILMKSKI